MFDRIRQVFSKPKPALAVESRAFITELAARDIWILAVGLRSTPVIPIVDAPATLDVVAAHRIDVAEIGDSDSVFPFNNERAGSRILPFFSLAERAREFAAAAGFPADLTVFPPYCLLAGFVSAPENDGFELLLDARSPTERLLTPEERGLRRNLTTAA